MNRFLILNILLHILRKLEAFKLHGTEFNIQNGWYHYVKNLKHMKHELEEKVHCKTNILASSESILNWMQTRSRCVWRSNNFFYNLFKTVLLRFDRKYRS